MTLEQIQARLVNQLRDRLARGELTERGFARRTGISQPHVHKVLKGARTLSPNSMDVVLKSCMLSVLDLCTEEELRVQLTKLGPENPTIEIPFLRAPIGPGRIWPGEIQWDDRYPVPCSAGGGRRGLALARVEPDELMGYSRLGLDIALIDPMDTLTPYQPESLYVVSWGGEALLRKVRQGARRTYLVNDEDKNDPLRWDPMDAGEVKGRVLWLGQEGHQRTALAAPRPLSW